MPSHQPKKLTLVDGKIKRGDTIESWTFSVAGIPEPARDKAQRLPGEILRRYRCLVRLTEDS